MKKITSLLVICFFAIGAGAQNITISGNVKNSSTKENVSAVSVTIKETDEGTFTDDKGNFKLMSKKFPITVVVSSVGFIPQEINVTGASQSMNVSLQPSSSLGQEVVVSASRVPQRILESPVTIERISAANLRNSPVSNFYDAVTALKGVDFTTSSLTFRTPTTRGFGGSGNTRFNQLVDGMDNQAPGLNFSVASIIGLNELDVDNMELLSGASSALYGPGGMNGTLLMTSKNPFKYQGLSFSVKQGLMHVDESERDRSFFSNYALRYAKKINDKFAFKITSEFTKAKDWIGMDNRNYDRSNMVMKAGNRATDPNYDGVNVYGDETSVDLSAVLRGLSGQIPFLSQYIGNIAANPNFVSRTGYTERDLMDPNTLNIKVGGSFHYKINSKTEAILAGYWGTGNTIYTGASRYSIKNFKMGQYKLELNNPNWMIRAFTTQENAGESYNLAATTQNFNEAWKRSITRDPITNKPTPQATDWYVEYALTYLQAKLRGENDATAHGLGRSFADRNRPTIGSEYFNTTYDKIRKLPVPQGGALLDRTDLYSIEGNYNFSQYTKKYADVLIGANFRRYVLNSQGTLFADTAGTIGINEFGAYIQAQRQIVKKLKVTASARYDKNQNFEGRFTPRVTAVYTVAPDNNIRLSYQTAYRFPSTQQQWINLDLVSYKLIGGNEAFNTIYNFNNNPAYDRDSLKNGKVVRNNFARLKPESISSFEIGYRGLLLQGKLLVDLYGYYGQFNNFLARKVVVQSKIGAPISVADADTGNIYSVPVNSLDKIRTWGFGIGLDYKLPKNFTISANIASDNLDDVPSNFIAAFNSPRYKLNATLANTGFGCKNRFGFALSYRWQDAFYFQGDLANGNLPAVQTLDAQVSLKIPSSKSIFKIGATNLLNQYYYNGVGNSYVGGLYYVGFAYNVY